MKKIKMSFYFVFVSFFTFLTIFFSIVQKSYFSFITPQKIIEKDSLLSDFSPNLDLTVISTIESKNKNTDEPFDFSIIKPKQTLNKTTPTPTIAPDDQGSVETITETEITPTPTLTSITAPQTEAATSAATSAVTSIKSSSVSTSTQ
ncbi:MAG: hypothetical protein PHN66_01000 [Candidatus Shapirobacteria bacterium]|nr:hypothetical protein [Candidatus Shapirobacteria bacterium]